MRSHASLPSGVGSPSDEFPTVLGRVSAVRETSKSSSKSVVAPSFRAGELRIKLAGCIVFLQGNAV